MIKEYIYNKLNEAMFFGVHSIRFSKLSQEHVLVHFHKETKNDKDIFLDESRVISPTLYEKILTCVRENAYVKKNHDETESYTKFKLQSPERKYTISCEFSIVTVEGFEVLTLIPIKKVHTATVSS